MTEISFRGNLWQEQQIKKVLRTGYFSLSSLGVSIGLSRFKLSDYLNDKSSLTFVQLNTVACRIEQIRYQVLDFINNFEKEPLSEVSLEDFRNLFYLKDLNRAHIFNGKQKMVVHLDRFFTGEVSAFPVKLSKEITGYYRVFTMSASVFDQ